MLISISTSLRKVLPERLHKHIQPFLGRFDAVLNGTGEEASSQRMAATVFSIRVISAVINFISQVLLARWMGTYEYGIFVAVWTAIIILNTLIGVGMPTATVRFVSKYKEEENYSLLWGVILGSTGLGLISSLLFASLALGVLFYGPQFLSAPYFVPVMIGMLILPGMVVATITESISRSFNWTLTSFVPIFILRPLGILVIFWAIFTFGFNADAITAMWSAMIASYAVNILQILLIRKKLLNVLEFTKPTFQLKYWLVVALPIFLVESFYVLLTSVDVLFVSWLSSPEDTAIYFAASKILALVHFVYFAVRSAASHRYSSYHSSGNHDGLASFVHQSISWTFWPSLVLGLLMVFLGKYFLMLFGNEFTDGIVILWILVAGIVTRSSVGPAESLLVMTGNQNRCAVIYIQALLINICLNLLLIPIYGPVGAAVATALAMTFESIALYFAIKQKLGIHVFIGHRFFAKKQMNESQDHE